MLFEIHSCPVNSPTESLRYYENLTGRIYDAQMTQIRFPKALTQIIQEEGERSYFRRKSRKLRTLRIQVGLGCNLHCAYCGQRRYAEEEQRRVLLRREVLTPEKKAVNLVERLSKHLDQAEHAVFIGGEPFLYLELLKTLVQALRKQWPQIRLTTITNGTLLTEETAEWCAEAGLKLIVSHDGPSSSAYRNGEDIFSSPAVINALRHYVDCRRKAGADGCLDINAVVTPENVRLSDLTDWFEKRLERPCRINFESIVKLNKETVSSVRPFSEEAYSTLFSEVLNAVHSAPRSGPLGIFHRKAETILSRLLCGRDLRSLVYACDTAEEDVMAVDTDGNLLACAPYPASKTRYGSLETLGESACDKLTPWTDRPQCGECPVLVSCLGGCAFQSAENHEIACGNLRLWHTVLLSAAWERLFGEIIVSIAPAQSAINAQIR